ncbi:MAG TPA: zinc ribbon domain-containing protein [Candidatus Kapabacteria bacterium]|nr:zinc ribbon domain-containing protein [Candidatus Kapabacteria bacterium]
MSIPEPMNNVFSCRHCGADIPPNASVCPECGSDESTGWADNANSYGALPAEYPPAYIGRDGRVKHPSAGTRPWVRYTVPVVVVAVSVPTCLALFTSGVAAAASMLAVALGFALWLFKGRSRASDARPWGNSRSGGVQYETLVRRARGDRARAERLIEYERRRNPSASRAELIRDAIDRLARD